MKTYSGYIWLMMRFDIPVLVREQAEEHTDVIVMYPFKDWTFEQVTTCMSYHEGKGLDAIRLQLEGNILICQGHDGTWEVVDGDSEELMEEHDALIPVLDKMFTN